MILVKLVAVCETEDCETRQDYELELSQLEAIDDGAGHVTDIDVKELPSGWRWKGFPVSWGQQLRPICPHCVKERRK